MEVIAIFRPTRCSEDMPYTSIECRIEASNLCWRLLCSATRVTCALLAGQEKGVEGDLVPSVLTRQSKVPVDATKRQQQKVSRYVPAPP